ncbi:MAG: hypothetical protein WB987_13580 [Candidatus Acidiferrales bacterium]
MRAIVRGCLVAALVAGMCELPAAGTSEKPLGVVVVAEHAHFAGEKATAGTTVYAGDAFDTEESGTLCLRVGTGQVFLLSDSAATFGQDAQMARVVLKRGTAVFSSPAPEQFEVETPAGMLRGVDGKAASGRVALTAPNEMVISAYGEGLVLDNGGELHSIAGGKAVRVVIEDSGASGTTEADVPSSVPHGRRRRILVYVVITGAVGGISAAIFNKLSESPYKP